MVKGLKQMADAKVVIEKLRARFWLKDIAAHVGVHVQTVYMWKMGTYRPSEENMKKLLELLDESHESKGTEEQHIVQENENSESRCSESTNASAGA
jgi:hypothetical protein